MNFMKLSVMFGFFVVATTLANSASEPMATVQSFNKLSDRRIEVIYNLESHDRKPLAVAVEISSNNGVTYYVPKNVSGDVGGEVFPGSNRRFVWLAERKLSIEEIDDIIDTTRNFRVSVAPAGMVLVPAGEFLMGEKSKKVQIDAFFIDKYEVTNRLFARFLNDIVAKNPKIDVSRFIDLSDQDRQIVRFKDAYRAVTEFADYPVIEVTWHGANSYAKWAGKRLPTDAEWEKAARGIDGRIYPWGDELNWTYANYNRHIGRTEFVSQYPKGYSPYGAYNMAGNVWEWVADLFDDSFFADATNKNNPSNADDKNLTDDRVVRGGSWFTDKRKLKCTSRDHLPPETSSYSVGFRCAK